MRLLVPQPTFLVIFNTTRRHIQFSLYHKPKKLTCHRLPTDTGINPTSSCQLLNRQILNLLQNQSLLKLAKVPSANNWIPAADSTRPVWLGWLSGKYIPDNIALVQYLLSPLHYNEKQESANSRNLSIMVTSRWILFTSQIMQLPSQSCSKLNTSSAMWHVNVVPCWTTILNY